MKFIRIVVAAATLSGCLADTAPQTADGLGSGDGTEAADLGLGEMNAGDAKADGNWGYALTCKTIPSLPVLANPEIVVSINGLTLTLRDRSTGFEKTFPVGVGAIDTSTTSLTYGDSLSWYPIEAYAKQDFVMRPQDVTACRSWWTDPETGQNLPVFAGLPFMRWSGAYAFHGPIDNYRAENGGTLRRGFVSHGCVRMESVDILELYARTKGKTVPVRVQREPERRADGTRFDTSSAWMGTECDSNSDCNFTGGYCHSNPTGGRGFCTQSCTQYCPDRANTPSTFCVADPSAPAQGMCVNKVDSTNYGCRPYDHFVQKTTRRFSSTTTASVCMPGSPGWVGDRCLTSSDCKSGTTCSAAGICTMACTRYCADMPNYASTFCVNDPDILSGTGSCVRQCSPMSNAPECPADHDCVPKSRNNDANTTRNVCIPR